LYRGRPNPRSLPEFEGRSPDGGGPKIRGGSRVPHGRRLISILAASVPLFLVIPSAWAFTRRKDQR